MRRPPILTAIVVALTLVLPTGAALGQPAGPTTVFEKRFQAVNPPAVAEVLQLVLDFAPGSWTPVHTHGGPGYVTVLEGEMTLRIAGADQKFRPGEGWIDNPDTPHAAGNEGSAPARVAVTFVLPKGATPTTVVESGAQAVAPPGPTTFAQLRMDALSLPTPMDLVVRFVEYAPGVSAAVHFHPGPNYVTVLEGELTLREGATEQKVSAPRGFVEPALQLHSGANMGASRTRLVAAAVVPRDAAFSTAAEQAAQPSPAAKPAAPATAPAPAAQPAPAAKPAPVQAPAPTTKPAAVASPAALPRTGSVPLPLDASLPAALTGLGAVLAGFALWRRRR
jgi:quercetin dioxygenase-like cupin family protein